MPVVSNLNRNPPLERVLAFSGGGCQKTEQQLDRELLRDIKKVEGKVQILFRVAEAVTEEPDGKVRDVIFSRVKEEVFRNLVLGRWPQFSSDKAANSSIIQFSD